MKIGRAALWMSLAARRAGLGLLAAFVTIAISGVVVRAIESAGGNYRITRSSINQGGVKKIAAGAFTMTSTAGETGGLVASGGVYQVKDGLIRIYYYPGAITVVTAIPGVTAGEIDLSWTAPGADGNLRTATSYVVKFSTYTSPGPIDTQAKFESATTFGQTLAPQAPGTTETLTLTGLQPGTSYYVAIEARDADDNQGYLSISTFSWATNTSLGVDIANESGGDPTGHGFGTVFTASAAVSTSTIRVTNTGTATATWSFRASTVTTGSPWVITRGSLGTIDRIRLSAAFDEVEPSSSSFVAADRMDEIDSMSSPTAFSIDGTTTGVNVPVGNSRLIWFMIETPLASSTTGQQAIEVTVTANP